MKNLRNDPLPAPIVPQAQLAQALPARVYRFFPSSVFLCPGSDALLSAAFIIHLERRCGHALQWGIAFRERGTKRGLDLSSVRTYVHACQTGI